MTASRLALALLLLAAAAPAPAAGPPPDEEAAAPAPDRPPELRPLTGTLARLRRSGAVRLGHRADAVPFSFLDARGRPVGYALDLCAAVVEAAAAELGLPALRVEHVLVTPEDRLARVAAGEIDLECGATSSTVDRQRLVAFSPTTFVSATRLLVRAGSPARGLKDLRGKAVAVTRGTTAVAVVRDLSERAGLGLRVVEAGGYGDALDQLSAGLVDAVAGDEVLLRGLQAQRRASTAHRVIGPPLSHEPYALAFQRGDQPFAEVVARAFRRLATSREIVALHDRWFVRPLPSGERLRLPMSRELEELWRIQGLPSDGS
jgi:glutamate/aspartate transport system substrate-binding protein